VAFVPTEDAGGKLTAGDVLVSNFNDNGNAQGTGTTIVEINPKTGKQTLFFQGSAGLGLTTALGVLPGGFVVVGNLPANGGGTPDGPGSLLIINKFGRLVKTFSDSNLLDGPWDLTIQNDGFIQQIFVSDVLNGTVTRLDLLVNPFGDDGDDVLLLGKTRIASGYTFRTDPVAFVIGPTGLALDPRTDTLYVASTGDNAVYAIKNAEFTGPRSGTGNFIFSNEHLRGPLALGFAPNGDLLAANGDAINPDLTNVQNSEIVEFTTKGKFVGEFQIDPSTGAAFGFAIETDDGHSIFAAVDDANNTLDIWDV
jgi:DNA-binding beta-propeller fold protein YncE